jgi:hypothetical protein
MVLRRMLCGAVFWYVLVIVHCLKTHSDLYGCTGTVSTTVDWLLEGSWLVKNILVMWPTWSDTNDTEAYGPIAGQRPQNGQVQLLLCSRRINKHPFLSSGSLNTFLRKQYPVLLSNRPWQQKDCWEAVSSVGSAQRLCNNTSWASVVSSSFEWSDSSWLVSESSFVNWCEMAASLGTSYLRVVSSEAVLYGGLWKRELVARVWLWKEDYVWYLECVIQWDRVPVLNLCPGNC